MKSKNSMSSPRDLQRVSEFHPGQLATWEWSPGGYGAMAAKEGIRPVGMVVDRGMRPHMAVAIGIEVLDDPLWVIDPVFALDKGVQFQFAEVPGFEGELTRS